MSKKQSNPPPPRSRQPPYKRIIWEDSGPIVKITDEGVKAGWYICKCRWKGMPLNEAWAEAEGCSCHTKTGTTDPPTTEYVDMGSPPTSLYISLGVLSFVVAVCAGVLAR